MALIMSGNGRVVLQIPPSPDPQALLVDPRTGVLASINLTHYQIHLGNTFQASHCTDDASPLSDNAALEMLLSVGSRVSDLTFDASCGGDAELRVYESPVVTIAGTAISARNMDRTSNKIAETAATLGPTYSNLGTPLLSTFLPGGTNRVQSQGGTVRVDTEWRLRPNLRFLIRLINRAGSSQPASIVAQWYEISE